MKYSQHEIMFCPLTHILEGDRILETLSQKYAHILCIFKNRFHNEQKIDEKLNYTYIV